MPRSASFGLLTRLAIPPAAFSSSEALSTVAPGKLSSATVSFGPCFTVKSIVRPAPSSISDVSTMAFR